MIPGAAPGIAPGVVRLRARGLRKAYAGTVALAGVDLELRAGEMLALVGANGAGKSTLVKAICGAETPDAGTLEVDRRPVTLRGVADALAAGIAVAHQQVAVIPSLTGAQNIMLGREPVRAGLIRGGDLRAEARRLADRFGVQVALDQECGEMGLGETKILDILKALAHDPAILVLDEPTASLTLAETGRLFAFLADLRRQGLSILFISHHLAKVFTHCDRVAVLRDGRKVHDGPVAETTLPEVVRLMVGRAVETVDWTSHAADGEPVMDLRGLRVGTLDVPELVVRRGEVVGIAGVLGAGQTALLERLAGVPHPARADRARLASLPRLPRSVAEAVGAGIVLVADDRLRKAVFRGLSVEENLLSASLALPQVTRWGFVRARAALALARAVIGRLRVKCTGPHQDIAQLSGGNQQKVAFGRWLARAADDAASGQGGPPAVLLLDNPTEGVDVGSKAELHALVRNLARQGAAVLVASAEFAELAALCDRVYCIARGSARSCLLRDALSEDRLVLEVS